jgi:D-alanine--poly(phosphoribitol) ligase subunit 1
MPGTDVFVVNKDREALPANNRGEIIIAGPNVSPGYLARPDLTANAFFQHGGQQAYRTGDLGRYRDNLLFFEGRIDGQIKLYGDIASNSAMSKRISGRWRLCGTPS